MASIALTLTLQQCRIEPIWRVVWRLERHLGWLSPRTCRATYKSLSETKPPMPESLYNRMLLSNL